MANVLKHKMDLGLRSASVKPLTSVQIMAGRFVETMVKRIETCAFWKRSRVNLDKKLKSNREDRAVSLKQFSDQLVAMLLVLCKVCL